MDKQFICRYQARQYFNQGVDFYLTTRNLLREDVFILVNKEFKKENNVNDFDSLYTWFHSNEQYLKDKNFYLIFFVERDGNSFFTPIEKEEPIKKRRGRKPKAEIEAKEEPIKKEPVKETPVIEEPSPEKPKERKKYKKKENPEKKKEHIDKIFIKEDPIEINNLFQLMTNNNEEVTLQDGCVEKHKKRGRKKKERMA